MFANKLKIFSVNYIIYFLLKMNCLFYICKINIQHTNEHFNFFNFRHHSEFKNQVIKK